MKIDATEYRVPAGEKVDLKKWRTLVKPVYKSKKHYHQFLQRYVEQLSALQRLLYASNRYALQLAAGGMIIFPAYEGFELIANTAKDLHDPVRTLPRAYHAAVGLVIALYVLVALVTVGNLPVDKIVAAKDYALAEAARPFLGQAGFLLIFAAVNAAAVGTGSDGRLGAGDRGWLPAGQAGTPIAGIADHLPAAE
jgi:amino acid transporter